MEEKPVGLEAFFPRWQELTVGQQALIRDHARERRFLKGQRPHHGSGDCSGLLLVKDGQLRVFILSEGGKEVTLYRLFAWDICLFSAACIMKNISFDLNVEAEKDTDVYVIPAEIYEGLMKSSLAVADYTNQLMASRFSDAMWVMEQILFTSMDRRLAHFLLEQSAIEQSDVLPITHEEIARNLGSVREVVTKMLNYLADEGLVRLSRGKVTILDEAGLRRLIR